MKDGAFCYWAIGIIFQDESICNVRFVLNSILVLKKNINISINRPFEHCGNGTTLEGEGRDRRDEKNSVYHFVHEPYPYERWRGHSTIFLHVSTRRDDLEGSRVEGFGALGPKKASEFSY